VILTASSAFAQSNLTSSVSGSTVTLSWSGASSGSYVVEAALVPGGPVIASLPVVGTSLTVPNVPAGTYYVRVRPGAGGAASNEVVVSVSSGCPAPPLPPTLIVRSIATQAQALWSPSGGCAPTSYTLFAGSAPGLSNITVVNAGPQQSVSAIAPPGLYYVRVLGTNAFGSAISEELALRVAVNAQSDTVAPNGAVYFDVVMTQTGPYQGTLLWNDASIDLDLYLTSPGCAYPPTGCLLDISDTSGTNTEQITRSVVAGETYRLWVDNFSTRTTAFTIFSSFAADEVPPAASEEPVIRKQK
jgi:hypothetical protein